MNSGTLGVVVTGVVVSGVVVRFTYNWIGVIVGFWPWEVSVANTVAILGMGCLAYLIAVIILKTVKLYNMRLTRIECFKTGSFEALIFSFFRI